MNNTVKTKLEEFYAGIIAYSRIAYPHFGIMDFAELAASAINYLIKQGTIYQYDKRECSVFMCKLFEKQIGQYIPQEHIDAIVKVMVDQQSINNNIAGIAAAIHYSK